MFEVPDYNMLHIRNIAGVGPFEPRIFSWNVFQMRYPLLSSNPVPARQVSGVKEAFKMQIICHAALDISDVIPVIQPRLYLFVFQPLVDNFAILEGQTRQKHPLSEEKPHLALQDAGPEIVPVKHIAQPRRQHIV